MKLFAALWPDTSARAALAEDLPVLAGAAGGRATAPDNLHLTVAFIGQVDGHRFDDVAALLAASRPPPFTVTIDHLQAFIAQRVLFRAPSHPPPALLDAQHDLVQRLLAARLPVDSRAFRPHVTLARRCDRAALAALVSNDHPRQRAARQHPIEWRAPGWALVESRSGPHGPQYLPHLVL